MEMSTRDLLEIPKCFQSFSSLGAILEASEDMNKTSSFSLFHSFDETARSQVAEANQRASDSSRRRSANPRI